MANLVVGVIGGSGLGALLGGAGEQTTRHEVDTPFGKPSDAIVETRWGDLRVLMLSRHGPGHVLAPSQVPFRANIFALKSLGCTHILASGAVGSLREEFKPRDLVVPDQVIDRTYRRVGTFFDSAAVHVELAEPFCPVLRKILLTAGQQVSSQRANAATPQPDPGAEGQAASSDAPAAQASESANPSTESAPFNVHDRGCYVCMEGPAFSTRAESIMHRLWGGDLIGMTAMPEAKLAREAQISYALLSLVTDYDSWRTPPKPKVAEGQAPPAPPDPAVLLNEILGNLQAASANALSVLRRAVELLPEHADALMASPARQALKLAIWSDKSRLDPQGVQRLAPLWMEYF